MFIHDTANIWSSWNLYLVGMLTAHYKPVQHSLSAIEWNEKFSF